MRYALNSIVHIWSVFVVLLATVVEAAQPNVLLIVSEDNGPEIGCYGDLCAQTPHLDRLASEGIRFERAYVPQAGCSQSRASFLTGLYPHQHGQIGLATWGFRLFRKDTANLPRSLKAAGYRTGLIGKLHINPASAFPFDVHQITTANFQRRDLAGYARHAESFINAGEEPFFLSVNYPDPHDPWIRQVDGLPKRPQSAADVKSMPYMGVDSPELREMVADYYNCIARMDSLVGDLLAVLQRSGKAADTIVVYIGDHGADMLRGKRTCYEGGLRIPMLLRWPGSIVPQIRQELVSTLDLMPTLLAATQSEPVERLPGRALQPMFQPGEVKWRPYFCGEYHSHGAAANYFPQRCIRDQRYKLIESLLPKTVHPDYENTITKLQRDYQRRKSGRVINLHAAIAGAAPKVQAAYETARRPPRYQLFDLQKDPYEFHNLAASAEHEKILERLRRELLKWREETKDPLLDDQKLRLLTNEVHSVTKKSVAKRRAWQYPNYLGQ